jgi:hypothetical protein
MNAVRVLLDLKLIQRAMTAEECEAGFALLEEDASPEFVQYFVNHWCCERWGAAWQDFDRPGHRA